MNDDDEEEEEDDNAGKRHFVVAQDQGEGSRSISKGTDITRKHSALVCHRQYLNLNEDGDQEPVDVFRVTVQVVAA